MIRQHGVQHFVGDDHVLALRVKVDAALRRRLQAVGAEWRKLDDIAIADTVEILREGVHSGTASGVAASSFRIARLLLDRIEDPATGRVLLPELHVDIPDERVQQAVDTAADLPAKLKAAKDTGTAQVDYVKADLAHRTAYVKLMALIGKP